jgi:hypothetical protein
LNRRVVISIRPRTFTSNHFPQTPTYLTGLIQEVSSILLGSFNVIFEANISLASSLTIIVRQGGVWRLHISFVSYCIRS